MRPSLSALVVLILGVVSARASEPCSTATPAEPCPTSGCSVSHSSTAPQAVSKPGEKAPASTSCCPATHARRKLSARAELLRIVDDTESQDTFMAAVVALGRLEDAHNRTLPIIIRKAEELGVLKGIAQAEQLTPVQMAVMDYLMGNAPGDAPAPPSPAPSAVAWPVAPPAVAPAPLAVFRSWLGSPGKGNEEANIGGK
jgi:hypothetical protein